MMGLSLRDGQRICRFCASLVPPTETSCNKCGRSLHPQEKVQTSTGISIEDRHRIYEQERVRIEAQQYFQKVQRKKASKVVLGGCLAVLAIPVLIVIAFGIFYSSQSYNAIPVGSEVTLSGSGEWVAVAVDMDAFEAYRDAKKANNKAAIALLALSERLLLVDNGTKARTVSDGIFLYEVRILGGNYAGRTGYLEKDWITYTKPK
jgi:hypothetical protein